MRYPIIDVTELGLIAIGSLLLASYPGRLAAIGALTLAIITLNIEVMIYMRGEAPEVSLLDLTLIVATMASLILIGSRDVFVASLVVALAVIVLAALYWDEEYIRSQYQPYYPLTILFAAIFGYTLGYYYSPLLILVSILESHLAAHIEQANSRGQSLIMHAFVSVILYSLILAFTRDTVLTIALIPTYYIKIIIININKLRGAYPSIDLFVKLTVGGLTT